MTNWLVNNIGNIVVSLLLVLLVYFIIVNMIKNKKKGKLSCGCNCAHCALAGHCHKMAKQ